MTSLLVVVTRSARPRSFIPFLLSTRRAFPPALPIRHASASATAQKVQTENLPSEDAKLTFSSLNGAVNKRVLQAVSEDMKITHLSPVQAAVLPLLPELARPYDPEESKSSCPRDLLVKAKTGTGKTLAFLLPAIEARLAAIDNHVQQAAKDTGRRKNDRDFERAAQLSYARQNVGTLIISPTRELANQIAAEALRVTQHIPGFGVQTLVGGENKHFQMRSWSKGRLDIVVGTPGRLRDLLMTEPMVKDGMSKAQLLILDEADTLLDMGFRDDIDAIKEYLPPVPERQTFLFSATVSPAIRQIAESSLASNHTFINCVPVDSSPVHAHIPQYHTVLPSATEQIPHLLRLITHDQLLNPGTSKIILFLPTTKMTQLFATILREMSGSSLPAGDRTTVYELHSKRDMKQRVRTSDSFRTDKSGASILVTSDVSARGVDYPGVSRVVQLGVPGSTEQYVHRVGRTGRANMEGRGDLVLLPWEMGFINTSLSAVPLKPLTAKELVSQVQELSARYDENPEEFFKNAPAPPQPQPQIHRRDGSRRSSNFVASRQKHHLFNRSLTTIIEDIERTTQDMQAQLEEEAIRETLLSNLGYYVGLSSELRLSKLDIVKGCKKWTTDAMGLQEEPYLPAAFLQRIGVTNEMSKSRREQQRPGKMFGLKSSGREPRASPWAERGQQRLRRNWDRHGERHDMGGRSTTRRSERSFSFRS